MNAVGPREERSRLYSPALTSSYRVMIQAQTPSSQCTGSCVRSVANVWCQSASCSGLSNRRTRADSSLMIHSMTFPGIDKRQQLIQALDDGVRLIVGVTEFVCRDIAVRDVHGTHADRSRPVDILEQPVPDEDTTARLYAAQRSQDRVESFRMRSGPQ